MVPHSAPMRMTCTHLSAFTSHTRTCTAAMFRIEALAQHWHEQHYPHLTLSITRASTIDQELSVMMFG